MFLVHKKIKKINQNHVDYKHAVNTANMIITKLLISFCLLLENLLLVFFGNQKLRTQQLQNNLEKVLQHNKTL